MKISSLGVYELKDIGNRLEIYFIEYILDVMMKRAPVGFL